MAVGDAESRTPMALDDRTGSRKKIAYPVLERPVPGAQGDLQGMVANVMNLALGDLLIVAGLGVAGWFVWRFVKEWE